MTLLMTLASRLLVMQSADFRLTNATTKQPLNFALKQVIANHGSWHASISFTGVASFGSHNTSDWLQNRVGGLRFNASFQDLLDVLRSADQWLMQIKDPVVRRTTFVAAGYVGVQPIVALVSNYERFTSSRLPQALSALQVQKQRPNTTKLFLNGIPEAVSYNDRMLLRSLIAAPVPDSGPSRQARLDRIHEVAAAVNLRAAGDGRTSGISKSCWTSVLTADGRGNSKAHPVAGEETYSPSSPLFGGGIDDLIKQIAAEHGIQSPRIVEAVFVSGGPTDEQGFRNMLQRFPDDIDALINYANLLVGQNRLDEAEEKYRAAVAAHPGNANPYGHLASFLAKHRELYDEAEEAYSKALTIDRTNAFVLTEYGKFLEHVRRDFAGAEEKYLVAMEYNRNVPQRAVDMAKLAVRAFRNIEKAEDWIARALEWDAGYVPALIMQAYLVAERGHYQRAIDAFDAVISVYPDNIEAREGRAAVLLRLKG